MTEFVDVVIVGAGISGISAAWHLQDRCPGKSYVILERRDNLGGTWDLFKYPGIRSDSDMFTLGFRFKPWTSAKAIADGPSIMAYLKETVAEYGIDKHIRYGHKVVGADWSDAENRWTAATSSATARRSRSRPRSCSRAAATTTTTRATRRSSPVADDFEGTIIHPQHWPEDLDYAGQEDRRHRQWRDRGDVDSGPCRFRRRTRDDAAAFADATSARCPTSTRSVSG